MFLLDVNVWLSACWNHHIHHSEVRDWFDQTDQSLYFCRITQLGLLRLCAHPSVMREDSLTRSKAWELYRSLLADPRIGYAHEPERLDAFFESTSNQNDRSHKLWTDDYLISFADASKFKFVTLDKAVANRYPSSTILIGD